MKPLISIALATYNGESFLAQQMDSLLAQDYPNLEIVISDDCSTDGTWEILQNYAAQDNRIRLLPRDINRGYVNNFIRTFHACKGSLISPSDQDDIWYPNKTRRLFESIGHASLVYCDNRFINEDGAPLGRNLSDTIRMISGTDQRNLLMSTSICGHAMLFKKNLLAVTPKLNAAPYIDWMIAFLAAKENGINYLDEVLVDWRKHSNSTSAHVNQSNNIARTKLFLDELSILSAFSSIPGEHQELTNKALIKLKKWREGWINLSMFFFVIQYGHITHYSHPAKHPSLKYLLGYKLKRLLRPNYY